jgi:glutathione-regulated potassium-efflux system protein KefC
VAVEQTFLEAALVYLAAAVIAVPLFKRMGLGAVLGYLVAGMAIGPSGLRLIGDVNATLSFSEFGVVLLMFLIGLELNPAKLWRLRKPIFGLGGAQVALSVFALTVCGMMLGLPIIVALSAATALAMSSTPIALQSLEETGQSGSMVGRLSFSTLLFQDIAVIPVLALVPLFGMEAPHEHGGLLGAARIIGVLVLIIVGGRYLLRPIFRFIAATKLREVFTAFSLLLVIGIGLLTQKVGISMALGTFLAGVLLAESEYRHELELNIEPFKGLLLGLFFIAVGMSVDLSLLVEKPLQIFAVIVGLIAVKGVILYGLGGFAGLLRQDRMLLAILLAQGGEFAFVLIALVQSEALISPDLAAFLVVVATFSMLITPLLLLLNDRFLRPSLSSADEQQTDIESNQNHVIVAGYGRFGQIIGRLMMSLKIPVTVVDHDPNQIEMLRRFDYKVYYGDASRLDLLEAAGIDKARLLVLAIDDADTLLETTRMVSEHYPHVPILARAKNRGDVARLKEAGAKDVRRELFSSSLELGELALKELGYGAHQAHKTVMRFRGYDEKALELAAKFRDDEKLMIDFAKQSRHMLDELMAADQEALSKPDKDW